MVKVNTFVQQKMAVLYFISFNLLKLQMPGFQNGIRVPFLSKLLLQGRIAQARHERLWGVCNTPLQDCLTRRLNLDETLSMNR